MLVEIISAGNNRNRKTALIQGTQNYFSRKNRNTALPVVAQDRDKSRTSERTRCPSGCCKRWWLSKGAGELTQGFARDSLSRGQWEREDAELLLDEFDAFGASTNVKTNPALDKININTQSSRKEKCAHLQAYKYLNILCFIQWVWFSVKTYGA